MVPKQLHLNVGYGNNDFIGPYVATLTLHRDVLDQLKKRTETFHKTRVIDPDVYKLAWWDYHLEIHQETTENSKVFDRIQSRLEKHDYLATGTERLVIEPGCVRLDFCIVTVSGALGTGPDIHWEACLHHNSIVVETTGVPVEYLQRLWKRKER